jgi:hypothetical protein
MKVINEIKTPLMIEKSRLLEVKGEYVTCYNPEGKQYDLSKSVVEDEDTMTSVIGEIIEQDKLVGNNVKIVVAVIPQKAFEEMV